MRCGDLGLPVVTTDVTIPEVIRENEKDVGALGRKGPGEGNEKK
jgi:hypothetical protein